jgi:phage-related protein
MTAILILLLFLGLLFPKPVKALLNMFVSSLGQIVTPFTKGVITVFGAILKKVVQLMGNILNCLLKVITLLFDSIRF